MALTAIDALRDQVRELREAVRNLERWAKTFEHAPTKLKRWVICYEQNGRVVTIFTPTGFIHSTSGYAISTFDTESQATAVIRLLNLDMVVAREVEVTESSVRKGTYFYAA